MLGMYISQTHWAIKSFYSPNEPHIFFFCLFLPHGLGGPPLWPPSLLSELQSFGFFFFRCFFFYLKKKSLSSSSQWCIMRTEPCMVLLMWFFVHSSETTGVSAGHSIRLDLLTSTGCYRMSLYRIVRLKWGSLRNARIPVWSGAEDWRKPGRSCMTPQHLKSFALSEAAKWKN